MGFDVRLRADRRELGADDLDLVLAVGKLIVENLEHRTVRRLADLLGGVFVGIGRLDGHGLLQGR